MAHSPRIFNNVPSADEEYRIVLTVAGQLEAVVVEHEVAARRTSMAVKQNLVTENTLLKTKTRTASLFMMALELT